MADLPRLRSFDSSLAFLADPYGFIGAHSRRLGSDAFEGRLLLRPTVFLHGAEAAELFYDATRFRRAGAAPEPLRATLFGNGTVQSLDGPAHRHRKALFLEATSEASVTGLVGHARAAWEHVVSARSSRGPVSLYDLAREVLTRSACAWAGVPLPEPDVDRRTRQLSLLFDGAGGGPRQHLRSRFARRQAEAWLADVLRQARHRVDDSATARIVERVAAGTDDDGKPLPIRVAAAELLNLLRPTVAVAVFIVFAAHALHEQPAWRTRLRDRRDPRDRDAFVQEVRRHYPFFPAVVARVRHDFDWHGMRFTAGRRALLDLFGTNHDPRSWQAPDEFRPERFLDRAPGLYDFIPQGGDTADRQHRCPGEGVTRALTGQAVDLLIDHLDAVVAPQDLRIDHRRLPALPRDRFLLAELRWRS